MPEFRSAVVDGRTVLLPVVLPQAPQNPPLADLNRAYREADAERRDEAEESVTAASLALRNSLCGERVMSRRVQKPLRAPSKP